MAYGDLSRINTNVQSLQAYSSLQQTNGELGMRQMRLATGTRLNRAEDDSASYIISQKLGAKVRGQAQALANIGDAKSMLTVGEGALNSVMDILHTMKEKATQAANDTMGEDERTAIANQLTELTAEIDDILGGAEFNGTVLFGGDGAGGDLGLSFQVGADSTDTFAVDIAALDSTGLGTDATGTASNYNNIAADDIDTLSFAGASDATGTFAIATGTNSGFQITYDDGSGPVQLADDVADLGGQSYTSADGFTVTFDASYSATNGDSFDVTGTASTDIGAVDVSDATNAGAAIATIDGAISAVADAVANLGDAQSRLSFKETNLQDAMNNYEAARSNIADADFAREQMQIVKLQILQQTGTAALAQANVAPQSVLSLLG